jgi:hypothetical protein
LVEDEWSKTGRDRVLSLDGGPLSFMSFAFRMWHNMRLGGATRGMWRIPDEKDESGLFSCSEFKRW